jgi:hypothetical protein
VANATGNSKAKFYASYYGQVAEEITAASDLTYYINSLFGAVGYVSYRIQVVLTLAMCIQTYI